MNKKIKSVFNPEIFQGWGKRKRYFEGWYFKLVNPSASHAMAIIPGVAMDAAGTRHAFIQLLDGVRKTAVYHKFDFELFSAQSKYFAVRIGDNTFSESGLVLNLPDLEGELRFRNIVPWPKTWYSPGIMGPYTFAPFMECYHGIVSMDHEIEGALKINNDSISFQKGRGYIEKDWGKSFPSAYFWMQSNHFSSPGISIKASVAKIPWLTGAFTGFIAGLWIKDTLYRFTTYNKTKLIRSFADKNVVELEMQNKRYKLSIKAERDAATSLASPIQGFMDGRIEESMTARLNVTLSDNKSGRILFDDTGNNAGLEVAGKIDEIIQ